MGKNWASGCLVFLLAVQLAGCVRLVSRETILASLPPSARDWEGHYDASQALENGRRAVLHLSRGTGDAYDFNLYEERLGSESGSTAPGASLIGRGHVRFADLGEGLYAAETRCAVSTPPGAQKGVHDTTRSLVDAAERSRPSEDDLGFEDYLGPYVYVMIQGAPDGSFSALTGWDMRSGALGLLAERTGVVLQRAPKLSKVSMDIASNGAVLMPEDWEIVGGGDAQLKAFLKQAAADAFANARQAQKHPWLVNVRRRTGQRLEIDASSEDFPPPGGVLGWCTLGLYFGK